MDIDRKPTAKIDYLHHPLLDDYGIRLGMLRLDAVHPVISGNKWFKLRDHIAAAQQLGKSSLLSFGGAYSNHLVATASAARQMGMQSLGIVRGLHAMQQTTETLFDCVRYGMQLHFISREEYRRKNDPEMRSALVELYPNAFIIPEGGNSSYGLSGAGRIAHYIPADASLVATAMGTGTTFAGIRQQLPQHIEMLGFPVMKGGMYLAEEIQKMTETAHWKLNDAYHCGGFGRHTTELIEFMNWFYKSYGIPLDFVYTAKMMWGMFDLLENGYFAPRSHIICIHTGGLQGNRSITDQLVW